MTNGDVGELRDSVVIVTGGGRGIGQAIATSLAAAGARLWICSRSPDELERTAEAIEERGGTCSWRAVDVADASQVDEFVGEVLQAERRIDVVIPSAGSAAGPGPLETMTDEDFRSTVSSNLDGLFHVLRATLPTLKAQDRGWILALSSGSGRRAHPRLSLYSAAKFAVQGMMQAVALELEETGVKAVTINPGGVSTRMLVGLFGQEEADKNQPPEAIARVVTQVLEGCEPVSNGDGLVIRDGRVTETYSLVSRSS